MQKYKKKKMIYFLIHFAYKDLLGFRLNRGSCILFKSKSQVLKVRKLTCRCRNTIVKFLKSPEKNGNIEKK